MVSHLLMVWCLLFTLLSLNMLSKARHIVKFDIDTIIAFVLCIFFVSFGYCLFLPVLVLSNNKDITFTLCQDKIAWQFDFGSGQTTWIGLNLQVSQFVTICINWHILNKLIHQARDFLFIHKGMPFYSIGQGCSMKIPILF